MSEKYARRSIKVLNALGITDYAILRLKSGGAVIFDRNTLFYRADRRPKRPLAGKKYPNYEAAMTAILEATGYQLDAALDFCLRCHSNIRLSRGQWSCECHVSDYSPTIQKAAVSDFYPYWISTDIPPFVAKCPKCAERLFIEEITEWDAETGIPDEHGFHINCSTIPNDGDYKEWMDWHWSMPYVDWHPLQGVIYSWFAKRAKAIFTQTAVFATQSKLRGVGEEWQLAPGTKSEAVFEELGNWWVRFPGKVDFLLEDVCGDSSLFVRLT